MEELLFTRKYNKEEYRFIITTMISWGGGKQAHELDRSEKTSCRNMVI